MPQLSSVVLVRNASEAAEEKASHLRPTLNADDRNLGAGRGGLAAAAGDLCPLARLLHENEAEISGEGHGPGCGVRYLNWLTAGLILTPSITHIPVESRKRWQEHDNDR